MRGDQKWPPQSVKEAVAAENEARRQLARGPACRPRKVRPIDPLLLFLFVLYNFWRCKGLAFHSPGFHETHLFFVKLHIFKV